MQFAIYIFICILVIVGLFDKEMIGELLRNVDWSVYFSHVVICDILIYTDKHRLVLKCDSTIVPDLELVNIVFICLNR